MLQIYLIYFLCVFHYNNFLYWFLTNLIGNHSNLFSIASFDMTLNQIFTRLNSMTTDMVDNKFTGMATLWVK